MTTVAGIGSQARGIPHPGASGPAKTTPLCSPWDVIQIRGRQGHLYRHGRYAPDLETRRRLGNSRVCLPEQAMKISRTGRRLRPTSPSPAGWPPTARTCSSPTRKCRECGSSPVSRADSPLVRTIVGQGLFEFGDKDGRGATVRLQHCLGLAYAGGHLYIADTYNNKIKISEPRNRSVHTLVGAHKAGDSDDPPHFYEPGGLSAVEDRLYVADTNNNKVRTVDLEDARRQNSGTRGPDTLPASSPGPRVFRTSRSSTSPPPKLPPENRSRSTL